MSSKGRRSAPTVEEMTPPVYEEGSNVGPNIAEDLDCEHLDADLFRSNQVSASIHGRSFLPILTLYNTDLIERQM